MSKVDFLCPLCSSHDYQHRCHVPDAVFSSRIKSFDVIQCTRCRLASIFPMPQADDINEIYVQGNVFSHVMENSYKKSFFFNVLNPIYERYASSRRYAAKRCLDLVKNKHEISILEIGCSTGEFLNECHKLNSAVALTGIDIDPQAKQKAPAYLRECIIIDDFLKHDFKGQFDVVCLSFVIEHLLDFKGYLRRAVYLLKPGGVLYISTPDIDSPKARQQGAQWNMVNDRRFKLGHIYWFNRTAIEYLAKILDLTIVRYNNFGELLYHWPIPVQKFLKKVFGMDHTGERLIRFYAPRIVYSLFVDCIIPQHFNYGECLGVYMRKKNT